MALAHRRPYGVYRWLANLPLRVYRLGLGGLLDHRLLCLTHRGRKSGQIRRTVLEVLSYDPRTHEVFVASAWEGKTDWYRNVQVEPALQVQIGWLHYRPVQEFLSAEETARGSLLFRVKPKDVQELLSGQRISDTMILQPISPGLIESPLTDLFICEFL